MLPHPMISKHWCFHTLRSVGIGTSSPCDQVPHLLTFFIFLSTRGITMMQSDIMSGKGYVAPDTAYIWFIRYTSPTTKSPNRVHNGKVKIRTEKQTNRKDGEQKKHIRRRNRASACSIKLINRIFGDKISQKGDANQLKIKNPGTCRFLFVPVAVIVIESNAFD